MSILCVIKFNTVHFRKLNDDDLVNDSVTQLKLMSISHPSFRVMMKLIANANEHFPKAKNLHVNARFYDDEMFGHGVSIDFLTPILWIK
jgi:hypothetical protein